MYTKKRSGPNTDPCGTPETTGRVVEEASFTTTYCSLSLGSQAFPVARISAFLKSGKAWDETSREG